MTKKQRGIYEKVPGSSIWWIRYADASGRIRREKVGHKSAAVQLYRKRKTQVSLGEKLPENFRAKAVTFNELADDALAYSRATKRSHKDDISRMAKIRAHFNGYVAELITAQDIEQWLDSHTSWAVATKNRYLALLKLTFRLGERNRKIKVNPARLVQMQKENNARVRYLNQHKPSATNAGYLKGCGNEESRLLAVIRKEYPFHLPEFVIAVNTGMRRSEQYNTEWPNVNFERRLLTVPRSKHGDVRHVPLNASAMAAFESLLPNMETSNFVFLSKDGHDYLRGTRHWFDDAVRKAGICDFHWHDLRHTFASRLAMSGVDIRTVQELLGHKTINLTCRYAHLAPAHQLAAVEKLDSFKPSVTESDAGVQR